MEVPYETQGAAGMAILTGYRKILGTGPGRYKEFLLSQLGQVKDTP